MLAIAFWLVAHPLKDVTCLNVRQVDFMRFSSVLGPHFVLWFDSGGDLMAQPNGFPVCSIRFARAAGGALSSAAALHVFNLEMAAGTLGWVGGCGVVFMVKNCAVVSCLIPKRI